MSEPNNPQDRPKPVTSTRIPGTEVPDVNAAAAESERQKRWMSRVAVSTAVMAAGAAISTMFSGGHLNQAMFEQINQANEWSRYQAKGMKRAVVESKVETAQLLDKPVKEFELKELDRYAAEQKEIAARAEGYKASSADHLRRYKILARAATCMQIGIALAAVALLLRRNLFWAMAIGVGLVGVGFLAAGFLG
jgi:hypothetical protein